MGRKLKTIKLVSGLFLAAFLIGCGGTQAPAPAAQTKTSTETEANATPAIATGTFTPTQPRIPLEPTSGTATDSDVDAGDSTATDDATPRDEGIPQDFSVRFARTACFGTCPQYAVEIDAGGNMKFSSRLYHANGHKQSPWVDGCTKKKLGASTMTAILGVLKKNAFMTLKDQYEGGPTDAPWINTKVTWEGHTKEVRHYTAAPLDASAAKRLDAIEKALDDMTGAAAIVKSGKPLEPCKYAG